MEAFRLCRVGSLCGLVDGRVEGSSLSDFIAPGPLRAGRGAAKFRLLPSMPPFCRPFSYNGSVLSKTRRGVFRSLAILALSFCVILLLAGFSSPAQSSFIVCLAPLPLFEIALTLKLFARVSPHELVIPELPILARLSDRAPPLA